LEVLKPKDTVNAAAMLGMNRSSTVMCGTWNLGFLSRMVSPGLNNWFEVTWRESLPDCYAGQAKSQL